MKKKLFMVLLILVAGAGILAHAATSRAGDAVLLRIFASKAVANRVDQIANRYQTDNPMQHITVTGGLISEGFPNLFKGDVDLAISSRLMNVRETALAHESGCKLSHRQCAGFMVAVIVHPENPLQQISLLDLAKIYAGEISNWKQMGGPDESIQVLGRHYPKEGIAVTFTEAVMGQRPLADSISLRDYDHSMILSVSRERWSIGYARSDAINKNNVKVLALKRDALGHPLMPIPAHLKDGSYPIIAKLTAYWNEESPRASPAVRFVDYCWKSLANAPASR